jgi:hypothetical protein
MLHQYTINDFNNQPSILKFWLTEKPKDTKSNTNTTNTPNTPKPSIIKNNNFSSRTQSYSSK